MTAGESGPSQKIGIVIPHCGGLVWVRERRGTGHLDGVLEFPGGKLMPGESPAAAALRELAEETGLQRQEEALRLLEIVTFQYADRRLELHFFLSPAGQEEMPRDGIWISPEALLELKIPPANRQPLKKLAGGVPPAAAGEESPPGRW